jgi:hypothetical protein
MLSGSRICGSWRWPVTTARGPTLAEYWVRRGDEAALRREMRTVPRTGLWLAQLLADCGRRDEAVEVLTASGGGPRVTAALGEPGRAVTSGPGFADTVRSVWQQQWPECPPVAHWLRVRYPKRWVRFHTLPGSKRYAESEDEYAIIIDRHNTVLDELKPATSLIVITCDWTDQQDPPDRRSPQLTQLDPEGLHWTTVQPDRDDDPDFRVYWHLFASSRAWRPGVLDDLLRAVADDELGNVIIGPSDLRWLYHPYDGGADVILPSTADRDRLRDRHRDWLSSQPSGL